MTGDDDEEQAYHEQCAYTLTLGDPEFIHQHVVDAYAAQRATDRTKPIAVVFSLLGLYLHVEHRWTGRQVQRAHMAMAREKRRWPVFVLPTDRGAIRAPDVLSKRGAERNDAIHAWCAAVWMAFAENRGTIIRILDEHGIHP